MKSSKSFLTFAALLMALQQSVIQAFAQPPTPRDSTWITNGNVNAVAYANGLTYIGGDFTYVGPNTGHGAALSTTTGTPDLKFPKVNGPIEVVAADGADGWYIGGRFTKVGDFTRNWIAHIKADGTVDPNWDPNPAGSLQSDIIHIHTIVVNGSTVYVGGSFTSIGGQQRSGIAALEASTGQATSWNPNADRWVRTIAIKGETVYVGGRFTSIGGQSRNSLAAIDMATGNATAWNPSLFGEVFAIVVGDTSIFAGGTFTSAGGQERKFLAEFGIISGQVTVWNPSANHQVLALALDGSTLYVGSEFNTVKGQTRNRLAALDITTADPTEWNPNANGTVRALLLNGANVYAGGAFTSIGAQTRNYLTAIDKPTGMPADWDPNPNNYGSGQGLLAVGSAILAGGAFTTMGGNMQDYFAQFGNIVVTNNPPHAPSVVNQYKSDGTTVISEGGTSNEKKVVFKATIADPDDDQVKLQIELRKITEAFTGVPTQESNPANSGTSVSMTSDTLVAAGYRWRYRVMDASGLAHAWAEFGTPSNTDFVVNLETRIDSNGATSLPTSYRLLQNHPNPFNAGTLITYEIPQAGPVSVKIYNLAGQEILEIVNAVQSPGCYQINWDGRDSQGKMAPSGVYVYKLLVNGFEETRKMTFMK